MKLKLYILIMLVCGICNAQDFHWWENIVDKPKSAPSGPYWNDPNQYAALWEFETNNAGTNPDSSGNGHTMTNIPNTSEPEWIIVGTNTQGRIEHGYSFNAQKHPDWNYQYSGQILNGATSVTMFAWVKRTGNNAYAGIFGESYTAQGLDGFLLNGDGASLRVDMHNAGGVVSVYGEVRPLNEFVFVCLRWKDGGVVELYTNAVYFGCSTIMNGPEVTDTGMFIGWYNYDTRFFPGYIDGVGITFSYLHTDSISAIYQHTNPTNNLRYRP